jgi:cyclase
MKTKSLILLGTVSSVLVISAATAQFGDLSKVQLKAEPVVGSVSVIEGANGFAGGNVAVSVGDDGVFLVDDELAGMTAKLKAKVATLSKKPIRFVVNTHWHFDHAGGNAVLGGAGAVLVAHENARKVMSVDQVIEMGGQKMKMPATPPAGLPILTFGNDVTLHVNGDEVHLFHVPPAHTDGDVIVHFKKANVIHAGDVFTAEGYPIVDVKAGGGRFAGLITAADRLLAISNDTTRIIPGHGPVVVGRKQLLEWKDMLVKVQDKVARLAAAGKTLDEIKAAKPTADLDAKYAGGFVKPDLVVESVYKSLPGTASPSAPPRP